MLQFSWHLRRKFPSFHEKSSPKPYHVIQSWTKPRKFQLKSYHVPAKINHLLSMDASIVGKREVKWRLQKVCTASPIIRADIWCFINLWMGNLCKDEDFFSCNLNNFSCTIARLSASSRSVKRERLSMSGGKSPMGWSSGKKRFKSVISFSIPQTLSSQILVEKILILILVTVKQ